MVTQALEVFGDSYATLYDEFYTNKDYSSECATLVGVAGENGLPAGGRVLDVGCGTGRHAALLAEMGYQVTGTDLSAAMLTIARTRSSSRFDVVDMDSMDARHCEFDLVYSLFDVLSYQTNMTEAAEFLSRLASWAKPGGLVIADAWHLAGLVNDPPVNRQQQIELSDGRLVTRDSIPSTDWVEGITEVRYHLEVLGGDQPRHFNEVHRMRAFTKGELELLAEKVGIAVVGIVSSPSLRVEVAHDDWHVGLIARRLANG